MNNEQPCSTVVSRQRSAVKRRYCTANHQSFQLAIDGAINYNRHVAMTDQVPLLNLKSAVRATVIVNPVSGTHNVRASLPAALDILRERGWQVDLQMTERAGDIGRLAEQARDQQQQVVIVAGGDGSLNEAANALAHSDTALGVLPSGTANVWARQIGLPIPLPLYTTQLIDAARALCDGLIRPIDLGQLNGRYFVLWAGVGLDAHVTARIEPRPPWVKRLGIAGYAWRAFWAATKFRGTHATITLDEQTIHCRALMVLISNAQLYGGVVNAAPDAQLDDGWLDVTIFKGEHFAQALVHMARYLVRHRPHDPETIERRARQVRITTKRPYDAHVDAEPIGQTPCDVAVVPRALRVIVPQQVPGQLFAD